MFFLSIFVETIAPKFTGSFPGEHTNQITPLPLPPGAGKTTLLRSLANRELRLPSGLSVLHVEQEVTGDDTLALDSVLQCDTEREQLLSRERELLAAANKNQADRWVILCQINTKNAQTL